MTQECTLNQYLDLRVWLSGISDLLVEVATRGPSSKVIDTFARRNLVMGSTMPNTGVVLENFITLIRLGINLQDEKEDSQTLGLVPFSDPKNLTEEEIRARRRDNLTKAIQPRTVLATMSRQFRRNYPGLHPIFACVRDRATVVGPALVGESHYVAVGQVRIVHRDRISGSLVLSE